MKDDLKKILSGLQADVEQEKLLQYLNRTLTEEEQHAIENTLNDDVFSSDAMDGLQQMKNTADIPVLVNNLNKNLKDQLNKHKSIRNKRKPGNQSWLYFSIILIILLAVIGYVLVRKFQQS